METRPTGDSSGDHQQRERSGGRADSLVGHLPHRQGESDTAALARQELLLRYHRAVLGYLQARLDDEHAIGQIFGTFALRMLEADRLLRGADPERGRFRDYLKAILRHLSADYYRERQRANRQREPWTPEGDREPPAPNQPVDAEDEQFLTCWRQELINHAWEGLAQVEKRTGHPYATLLRLQDEQPDLRSRQLAEQLTARLDRPFTDVGVRQLTHRAREVFGDLLVREAARSLEVDPASQEGADRVEEELIALRLLFSYCKTALQRCVHKA